MDIQTHQAIDIRLCGHPLQLESGRSQVELVTTAEMAVDDAGLVHGGFIFGLADHAAMIAVNHPYVVLGAAAVTFIRPVKVGETVTAWATVTAAQGKKQVVAVKAESSGITVFEGDLTCFILERHVLAPA